MGIDGKPYVINPLQDEQFTQVDLDGDGREEIFYYEGYDLNLSYTPNPPPVIFSGGSLRQIPYTGPNLVEPHGTKILTGDFNGDNRPDLFSLVAIDPPNNSPQGTILTRSKNFLLFNSKKGLNRSLVFPELGYWYTGCSGDIDKDGDLDIIAFNFHTQANNVPSRIYINDGLGDFRSELGDWSGLPQVYQSELVDINGDGLLDLVIVYVPSGQKRENILKILWGNGRDFSLNRGFTLPVSGNFFFQNLDFVDLDGDRSQEIIATGNEGNGIYSLKLFRSEPGKNSFTDQTLKFIDQPSTSSRLHHLIIGDPNGKGTINLFSADRKDNIIWEWNRSILKLIRK